jgi:hypothetical protein
MKIEEKYPKDFQEFLVQFPNDDSCWQYLICTRWPDGYISPYCGLTKYWLTAKHKIHCSGCEREVSITSGTIFQESKKPLPYWQYLFLTKII